jgi:hypothetical protein
MNAETSAWGRAIMAALAVDEPHIASRDEVQNRRNDETQKLVEQTVREVFPESQPVKHETHPAAQQPDAARKLAAVASVKQTNLIKKLCRERQIDDMNAHASDVLGKQVTSLSALTTKEASKVIESLMNGG